MTLSHLHQNPAAPLQLPSFPVRDRFTIKRPLEAKQRLTICELDGPGCIDHIWCTLNHPFKTQLTNRKLLIRIYFDGSTIPHVEAPVGDFFGVMHGAHMHEINTPYLSCMNYSGYNCYFKMPFAKSARIEMETGEEANHLYLQVNYRRFPDQVMEEPRRFCARWRKENPTRSYADDFLMLDADGPGYLAGFVYSVRLIDNEDRWSHGGADNIYIDGQTPYPAFLRGIGGEDTFGASYGGAHHPPDTHLWTGFPYYEHEDIGEPRRVQRLTAYRFFDPDPIPFRKSIHMRFGCMQNNICCTMYWYQTGEPRPYVKLPSFEALMPDAKVAAADVNLPLPDSGSWRVQLPFDNEQGQAVEKARSGIGSLVIDNTAWRTTQAIHGFVDFNLIERPRIKPAVGAHYNHKAAIAHAVLNAPQAGRATLHLAWDDTMVVQINDQPAVDLGNHTMFRQHKFQVDLKAGANDLRILLSNTTGSNHGGWAFAFYAVMEEGQMILPEAPSQITD